MITAPHVRAYYAETRIPERMVEFLGGESAETATCVYVTATPSCPEVQFLPRPPEELWSLWEQGFELSRSLWDRESLIAHLDIEYVNFDYPAVPYVQPGRAYDLQMPVIRGIQEELLAFGIAPLHLLSGRGHHFVWRIPRTSRAFGELVALDGVPGTLLAAYDVPREPRNECVGRAAGAAHIGLGQVLEYLAHRVLRTARPQSEIPVEITAVEGNGGKRGREIVSFDLSEYADPLHARTIRIPFSAYHKPQQQRAILGDELVEVLPPLFMIPLYEMSYHQGYEAARDPARVADLARYAPVRIPDQSEGTLRLIQAYHTSTVAAFHREFYREQHDRPERWPDTYDRVPLAELPPCARHVLEHPNELLLKPSGLRHVVRVLLALGWHPRHIAGLIRSKYDRDYGWGDKFVEFDAATRADYWARTFAGLASVGPDDLDDFTCLGRTLELMKSTWSHDVEACHRRIDALRQSLLARRAKVMP